MGEAARRVNDQELDRAARARPGRGGRDGLIAINPAKNRAKRSLNRNAFRVQPAEQASPRAHAIPDMGTLTCLAEACGRVDQAYSDFVMLASLLAARSSEVSGLQAGDLRFDKNVVVTARQTYPGKGGLVTKQTKGRKERRVPILDPLRPILERLTKSKEPEDRLLVGPKGGALTTATVRDATNWDQIVKDLGLPDLTRHGLRHTGATWMADAGIPLHVLQDILGHASVETTAATCIPTTAIWRPPPSRPAPSSNGPPRPAVSPVAARRGPCRGVWRSANSVLVPFWSPYPQVAPFRGRQRPTGDSCRASGGTRRGPTKTCCRT